MTPKENIVSKAKASISWIYSNILGKTAEAQLRTANEIVQAREEYVSWVSYLLPIEQAINELEELKRDVARYFELANTKVITPSSVQKFREIHNKLMTVGEEKTHE